jgi:hypothetical protein
MYTQSYVAVDVYTKSSTLSVPVNKAYIFLHIKRSLQQKNLPNFASKNSLLPLKPLFDLLASSLSYRYMPLVHAQH